jgi:hypothetical protein
VLHPERNIHRDGFLGLYDKDIAIVTCFCYSNPLYVDLYAQVQQLSNHDSVIALGRAFNSGTLMSVEGQRIHAPTTDGPERALIYTCPITEVRFCLTSYFFVMMKNVEQSFVCRFTSNN